MSGIELVAAFLAGVFLGGALDFFVLPLLVLGPCRGREHEAAQPGGETSTERAIGTLEFS